MLTQEQNDFLTRTGAGTPMGDLFRRYWLPALLLEELPAPDCPPVRVKLLGERMIAFRDSEGRVGIMDEFCAHRGVSLWFGRNERNGLRCPYHGWKYDVTGQCIELPSDENCVTWNMTHHPSRPLTQTELHAMRNGQGMYAELIPGSYRPLALSAEEGVPQVSI